MRYNPDTWAILSMKESSGNTLYKVAAGWAGSYAYGASWKVNSGIERIQEDEYSYSFFGYSGSIYVCRKSGYGLHWYAQGIIDGFLNNPESVKHELKLLTESEAISIINNFIGTQK